VCYKTKKDKIKGWLAVKFLLKLIKNFNKWNICERVNW
jgi:hypothetical protein